jgi:hypothetical protein
MWPGWLHELPVDPVIGSDILKCRVLTKGCSSEELYEVKRLLIAGKSLRTLAGEWVKVACAEYFFGEHRCDSALEPIVGALQNA